jgi:hypothetical protein
MTDLSTLLPALSPRQQAASGLATRQSGSNALPSSTSAGNAAVLAGTSESAVSLSSSGLDLSAQGLADRAAGLGNATIDIAQDFIGRFAQQLFGDSANGATLSFDSASLESQSSYAAALSHGATSGYGGLNNIRDSAAFSLSDSAHFIGKGTLTTADGQRFEFEVEVSYTSRIEAAAGSEQTQAVSNDDNGDSDKSASLPLLQLPDTEFPGTLSDLFKLLGRQLSADISASHDDARDQTNSEDGVGRLSLRMLKLVNSSTVLGSAGTGTGAADVTQAGDTDPAALDLQRRAKALSDAYAVPEQQSESAPLTASDPAAATR